LLHAGSAFSAATMASFVSASPISGTVPSSSKVAGSKTVKPNTLRIEGSRTSYRDGLSTLGVDPFPVDERLGFDQGKVLQTELLKGSVAVQAFEKTRTTDAWALAILRNCSFPGYGLRKREGAKRRGKRRIR
jgi:hypothetical protein